MLFKGIFTNYYVTKYEDWKTSSFSAADFNSGNNVHADYMKKFTSPVRQEAALILRWMSRRKYPMGACDVNGENNNENQMYNMILTNERAGERKQKAADPFNGYVYHWFSGQLDAGAEWKVKVSDWYFWRNKNTKKIQDFRVTLYTAKQKVEWEDLPRKEYDEFHEPDV